MMNAPTNDRRTQDVQFALRIVRYRQHCQSTDLMLARMARDMARALAHGVTAQPDKAREWRRRMRINSLNWRESSQGLLAYCQTNGIQP